MIFKEKVKETNTAYHLRCASQRGKDRIVKKFVFLGRYPMFQNSQSYQYVWLFLESILVQEAFELLQISENGGYNLAWGWFPKQWRKLNWHPAPRPMGKRISNESTKSFMKENHIIYEEPTVEA